MKKLIVGLLTTFLLATGLVAFVGSSTANAAAGHTCPYTGCAKTRVDLQKLPYTKYKNNRLYQATVVSGSAKPKGTIQFTLYKGSRPSGKEIKSAMKQAPRDTFNTGTRLAGTYTLKACYIPAASAPFNGSCGNRTFTFNK